MEEQRIIVVVLPLRYSTDFYVSKCCWILVMTCPYEGLTAQWLQIIRDRSLIHHSLDVTRANTHNPQLTAQSTQHRATQHTHNTHTAYRNSQREGDGPRSRPLFLTKEQNETELKSRFSDFFCFSFSFFHGETGPDWSTKFWNIHQINNPPKGIRIFWPP